jgi:hypothetical protein
MRTARFRAGRYIASADSQRPHDRADYSTRSQDGGGTADDLFYVPAGLSDPPRSFLLCAYQLPFSRVRDLQTMMQHVGNLEQIRPTAFVTSTLHDLLLDVIQPYRERHPDRPRARRIPRSKRGTGICDRSPKAAHLHEARHGRTGLSALSTHCPG